MKTAIRYILIALSLVVLLSGCSQGQVRVLWNGVNLPGEIAASYSLFDGTERNQLKLEKVESVEMDYDVQITGGAVRLSLAAPDGSIVQAYELKESKKQKVEISIQQDGTYTLTVQGINTSGKFAVAWGAK